MIEKYLHIILVTSIVIACLALLTIIIYVIIHFKRELAAKKILQHGRRSDSFIYNLLATSFPKQNLIKNARIPAAILQNNSEFLNVDLIAVSSGGIAVIKIFNQSGKIDDPIKGDWVMYNGGEGIRIANPFEINSHNMHAVEQIIKRERLSNIPVRNIVVFTSTKVTFRNRYDQLKSAKQLYDSMLDMKQNKFLTSSEVRSSVSAIRKYMRPHRKQPPHRPAPQQNVNR